MTNYPIRPRYQKINGNLSSRVPDHRHVGYPVGIVSGWLRGGGDRVFWWRGRRKGRNPVGVGFSRGTSPRVGLRPTLGFGTKPPWGWRGCPGEVSGIHLNGCRIGQPWDLGRHPNGVARICIPTGFRPKARGWTEERRPTPGERPPYPQPQRGCVRTNKLPQINCQANNVKSRRLSFYNKEFKEIEGGYSGAGIEAGGLPGGSC